MYGGEDDDSLARTMPASSSPKIAPKSTHASTHRRASEMPAKTKSMKGDK